MHDPTYVRIFKIVETIEIDSRMVVIRLEGGGNEELLFNGYSFSYARSRYRLSELEWDIWSYALGGQN